MMANSMFGERIDHYTAMRDQGALLQNLQAMDDQTLRDLLQNNNQMDEYIASVNLESRNKMKEQKEMIMVQNKTLAEFNLTFEPKLRQGREYLKELMVQIEPARNSVVEKESKMRNCITAETALALLQTAAVEIEDESDKLADSFYQKEIEVEEFLERFQEIRKRMHLRRVKADKMVELVSQTNARPLSGHRRAAPPPPYPVSPPSMFMPNNI